MWSSPILGKPHSDTVSAHGDCWSPRGPLNSALSKENSTSTFDELIDRKITYDIFRTFDLELVVGGWYKQEERDL